MKKWNTPVVEELSISATEHRFFGEYSDGGYVGDGVISGHNTWIKSEEVKSEEEKPENQLS